MHRLVAFDDREAVGGTMNLPPHRTSVLCTLRTGECLAFTEGLEEPCLVRVGLAPEFDGTAGVRGPELAAMMDAFWRERPELRHRYAGCTRCDRSADCRNPVPHPGAPDAELLDSAFLRLFNASRLSKPCVVDSFLAFDRLHRQDSRGPHSQATSYCDLVRRFETEIEKRAAFAFWPFAEVDRLAESICVIAWTLCEELGRDERSVVERRLEPMLRDFANRTDRLHAIDRRPMPGCSACESPCQYRFDARFDLSSSASIVFQERFRAEEFGEREWKSLGRHCQRVMRRRFPGGDLRSIRGAALCFAVQQFTLIDFADDLQKETAHALSNSIARSSGERE